MKLPQEGVGCCNWITPSQSMERQDWCYDGCMLSGSFLYVDARTALNWWLNRQGRFIFFFWEEVDQQCKHISVDGLPKDGFYWIALKVICQCPKGQKKVKYCHFATFRQFSQTKVWTFLFLCIQLLGDDIGLLSWEGFYWIIRKVIFKVGKVIIIDINKVLPKFIAQWSFFGMKPIHAL